MGVETVGEPRAFAFSWRRDWWIVLFWTVSIGAFVWGLAR